MKQFIASLAIGFAVVLGVNANTVTSTLVSGAVTNLVNGPCKVTQIALSATSTNASAFVVDCSTNTLVYVIPAYTNISYYVTNGVQYWTNYWGATTLVTNTALAWVTNSVAQTTNSYPTRAAMSALASTTAKLDQVSYYFSNGVEVTNTGTGNQSITITYQQ